MMSRLPGMPKAGRIWGDPWRDPLVHFRLPDKRRPVLILTRDGVIDRLNEIIVVPATRTIRGLTTEVVLTIDDGMPATCALNFDHVSLAQRGRIGPVLCNLMERRRAEVRRALFIACGFREAGD